MKEKTYYTLKEISSLIKTPIPYLRRMINEHKLVASYIGKSYIVSEEDLSKFITNCKGAKNER